jgi:heme exporter protein D
MPDLGKYAAEVLLAYGATIAILVVTVVASWRQSSTVARALAAAEARKHG